MTTLEDVIHHLQEMTALIERLFIDICEGKKDTRILLRFLNNLCVEAAGEVPVDNATNELSKDANRATSSKIA